MRSNSLASTANAPTNPCSDEMVIPLPKVSTPKEDVKQVMMLKTRSDNNQVKTPSTKSHNSATHKQNHATKHRKLNTKIEFKNNLDYFNSETNTKSTTKNCSVDSNINLTTKNCSVDSNVHLTTKHCSVDYNKNSTTRNCSVEHKTNLTTNYCSLNNQCSCTEVNLQDQLCKKRTRNNDFNDVIQENYALQDLAEHN